MILHLDQLSPANTYYQMMQTLMPRPVAWVLSENDTATYNLAPFSYFNAVCSSPAIIMLSVGKKSDGSDKDTCRNIIERKHFTLHISDESTLQALNQTSTSLDKNVSELDDIDVSLINLEGFALPRIAECKIAYACELHQIHEIGNTPQSVIYGEVKAIYIDDSLVSTNEKGRIKVHADRLKPISRLGSGEFMSAGDVIKIPGPK